MIESGTPAADVALLQRVMNGDEAALTSLYDRYSSLVYSIALRVLRDRQAAEEVLQDIFYQLWRTADRFDPARGSLVGWLLVAARNRAISRLRQRNPAAGEDLGEIRVELPFDVENATAQKQLLGRVRSELERLPAEQRAAFELAYFEGLTHSEIAARTGEPLGTIKSRLRAGVESLKRALNP
ncbi:MAG TPA: sigma-70 family RNA polymerase sigma factor [Candidatus Xenobia bacterium]|nr:sigma-70 family RNA polymerase sigma factor [Candidatus Xenobia bacterium]